MLFGLPGAPGFGEDLGQFQFLQPRSEISMVEWVSVDIEDPGNVSKLSLRVRVFGPFQFTDDGVLRSRDEDFATFQLGSLSSCQLLPTEFSLLTDDEVDFPTCLAVDQVELPMVRKFGEHPVEGRTVHADYDVEVLSGARNAVVGAGEGPHNHVGDIHGFKALGDFVE